MAARKPSAPSCLIVDEHPVVRQGVRALLESTWPDAAVTDAENLDGAVENGVQRQARRRDRRPWRAGADVGELVKRLTKELSAPIVVFTADGGARLLSEALKAGVKGYVRKDSPSEDLVRAIEAARGGRVLRGPRACRRRSCSRRATAR